MIVEKTKQLTPEKIKTIEKMVTTKQAQVDKKTVIKK
jgi:hypothetical protein